MAQKFKKEHKKTDLDICIYYQPYSYFKHCNFVSGTSLFVIAQ